MLQVTGSATPENFKERIPSMNKTIRRTIS